MQSTLLSTIISRMNRWRVIEQTEEQFKVRDLDEAIRTLRREFVFPWTLQKGSLRVFKDVEEYPVASDHDELAYLDTSKSTFYPQKARFWYTSIQQFFEDSNNSRNNLAEIWESGTKYLGVRYSEAGLVSQLLSTAEVVGDYSVADDADAVVLDSVIFKEGNGSMKVTVVDSASIATIKDTFDSFTDANYKRKYQFRWIYLDAVPTSIEMRFQVDDSNYLKTVVTTQFSGQAFKADQWNLIAQDLNEATEVGTISTSSIWASEKVILNGADTGTYYLDTSYLKSWVLMDYWYYSNLNVILTGSTSADQQYFFNSDEIYSSDSSLLGDTEWADVIQFDAMMTCLGEEENQVLFSQIKERRDTAWNELEKKYPDMVPAQITQRYRFTTDFNK